MASLAARLSITTWQTERHVRFQVMTSWIWWQACPVHRHGDVPHGWDAGVSFEEET